MVATSAVAAPAFRAGTDRLGRIESQGVEYIPEAERDSRPANLAAVFLGGNLAFSVIVFGWLPITFGLSFGAAVAASLIGLAVGTAVTAPLAILGTRTGTNNPVSSGAHFGVRGRLIGSGLTLAFALAFVAISVWTGGDALVASSARLLGTPENDAALAIGYALITAGIAAVALFGHATVVAAQKAIVPVVGVLLLAGIAAFAPDFKSAGGGGGGTGGGEYLLGGFWSTWMLALVVAAAGPISYAPSLGDYTRRISHERHSDARVVGAAALGVFGGLAATTLFGAFTASALTGDSGSYVLDLVAAAPAWYVLPILVIGLAGSVGQGAINLYATGLDMESLVPRLKRAQATLTTTAVAAGLVFLGTFVLDAVDSITALSLVLNAIAAPWVAVLLVGMIKSRATYDPQDLQVFNEGRTGGRYWFTRGWNAPAVIAWGAGAAFGLLTVNTSLYAGPLSDLANGVDLSLVGSAVIAAAIASVVR
jgi:purine-cytosine permease-like protein